MSDRRPLINLPPWPTTHSVSTNAPLLFIGLALLLLIFFPVPETNQRLVDLTIAGLLGFLARGDRKAASPPENEP